MDRDIHINEDGIAGWFCYSDKHCSELLHPCSKDKVAFRLTHKALRCYNEGMIGYEGVV